MEISRLSHRHCSCVLCTTYWQDNRLPLRLSDYVIGYPWYACMHACVGFILGFVYVCCEYFLALCKISARLNLFAALRLYIFEHWNDNNCISALWWKFTENDGKNSIKKISRRIFSLFWLLSFCCCCCCCFWWS